MKNSFLATTLLLGILSLDANAQNLQPNMPQMNAQHMMQRVFQAHPRQLKLESGWDMKVTRNGNQYILRTTTSNKKDVDKIRGLGYIGLMAYGVHHQKHHWMMANDMKPHKQ